MEAGTWGAVVLLVGGKRKESRVTRGHWPEQLGGCTCPVLGRDRG